MLKYSKIESKNINLLFYNVRLLNLIAHALRTIKAIDKFHQQINRKSNNQPEVWSNQLVGFVSPVLLSITFYLGYLKYREFFRHILTCKETNAE